jgi:CRP-like cAMP-binding protein
MNASWYKIVRYAVPKDKLLDLIHKYNKMHRQHIPQLIREAEDLISGSEKVELEHTRQFSDEFAYFWPQIVDDRMLSRINSAAVRLYLWLLVKQEEAASRNQWRLKLTDTAVASQLGVSARTVGTYRQQLQKIGLLVVREGTWMVRLKGNFQLQP